MSIFPGREGRFGMVLSDLLRLEDVLDTLKVGISILDNKGTFLFVSRAILKTSGRTRSDYIGKTVYQFVEKGIFDKAIVDIVYKTKAPITHIQTTIATNGKKRKYCVKVTPVFDGAGNIEYAISERYDIQCLNQEYNKANEMAQQLTTSVNLSGPPSKCADIIAESAEMQALLSSTKQVAQTDATVLLSGESGTGKEVFAHYIHQNSQRSRREMTVVNCAALPESLLEAELFGYEKGAFTGALNTGKTGLIESAHGGTLFLDEINSVPLAVQAKLLRTLETKTITHIGSVEQKPVDFRLIAATNADLEAAVKNGEFRADLFFRLNVVPLTIPPLREHKSDIVPLAEHFLGYFCRKYDVNKVLSKNIYALFQQYSWPGNVRELRNVVERLVVMSTSATVKIEQIPESILPQQMGTLARRKDAERLRIEEALRINDGHRERTAKYLGISRRSLQYKLRSYHII